MEQGAVRVWETSPSSFTCLLVVIQLLMLGRGWSELNQMLSLAIDTLTGQGQRTRKC